MKQFVVAIGVLCSVGLTACFCVPPDVTEPSGDGQGSGDGGCEPYALQTCFDWRCANTRVYARKPNFNQPIEVSSFSGDAISVDIVSTEFEVIKNDDGSVRATYSTQGCQDLVVTVVDGQHASFTWEGFVFTGKGALSPAQQASLESLKRSPLISGLVGVPLELGCQPDLQDAQVAALLFPFQVLLKYDSTPDTRSAALEKLGKDSTCKYFGKRIDLAYTNFQTLDGGKRMGALQFAPSDLIPNVFGYFALDSVGMTKATGEPLEGDLAGPCGALCRGACGPDCPPTCAASSTVECATDGGVDQAVQTFTCGVHNGCVEHDNCYDACYATNACGSVGAFFCRRGCDAEAVNKYGTSDPPDWARGKGPFQRFVTFQYKTPAVGACSCVAPGTEVTLDDGSNRAIETLNEGDGILAYDLDAGVITKARIEHVLVHREATYALDQLEAASGQALEVTANHPIFTARGFVKTEDLVVGDTLFIVDHVAMQTRQEQLISITRRHSTSAVTYNLKTTVGNYFAADMLIHNKCVAADSRVDTDRGPVAISHLEPGDWVHGRKGGEPVLTRVLAVYRKETVLPSLSGRRLADELWVTDNHVVSALGGPAGDSTMPPAQIEGAVFDLETETGNFIASGVLLEAANSTLQSRP